MKINTDTLVDTAVVFVGHGRKFNIGPYLDRDYLFVLYRSALDSNMIRYAEVVEVATNDIISPMNFVGHVDKVVVEVIDFLEDYLARRPLLNTVLDRKSTLAL